MTQTLKPGRTGIPGRLSPSRAVAFGGLAVGAAATYYLAVIGASTLLNAQGGVIAAITLFVLPLLSAIAAAALLPARRTRAWVQVMLAKHLFTHRYDYRSEWLRFTTTLGRPGKQPAPLEERVVQAIAEIVGAPGGLLLLPDANGLVAKAGWHFPCVGQRGSVSLAALLGTGWIVDIDALRFPDADPAQSGTVPEWMFLHDAAWAVVPLIHFDRLAGAVLLEQPVVPRSLDWEDFDLLRVAGRQVASYLAEAAGQEALSEAERFDEFNRRFAFIMHDIKNLVSQLSLVARNAQRHADNPDFRKDMIVTLNASSARMNDLLAKLSQHNKARYEEPCAVALAGIVNRVALVKRVAHPVVVAGDPSLCAIADPARLEAALTHIVQNAIEASEPTDPVTITMVVDGDKTGVEVTDTGTGMTADFISGQLFRAFSSTKDNGFGVGAYEARALVSAMGGRIAVRSAPGLGSSFTIWLPAARALIGERAA